MPNVVIKCPKTGREVPVGISMDAASWRESQMENNVFECPACGDAHAWGKSNARLQVGPFLS